MPKLIVMMIFDYAQDDGELRPAQEPQEFQSEEAAIYRARLAAPYHAGVIAWAREAEPNTGDYGDPVELFRHGAIPDLE